MSAQWIPLGDEAATLALGALLARHLPGATPPLVMYLHGDLGAGKTTLARGVLRALGETGPVRSPTYALLAEYEPRGMRVLHLDLYRLVAPDELQALGLADLISGSHLWLVEWPERAEGIALPPADVHVWIEPDGSARRVRLESASAQGEDLVAQTRKKPGDE